MPARPLTPRPAPRAHAPLTPLAPRAFARRAPRALALLAHLAPLAPLVALSAPARAEWHLDAALVTDVPVALGAEITATAPHGIRLGTTIGLLPGAYVSLINGIATDAGWYEEPTADLIDEALTEALVWTVQIGWQPWADRGLHLDIGYGLVSLGGATSSGEVLAAANGRPALPGDDDADYTIDSTLHTLRVDIGWRFDVYDALYIDAAIGVLTTLDATTTITPPPTDRPFTAAFRRQLADDSEASLDETYTTYVHSPTLTLAVGWRFF